MDLIIPKDYPDKVKECLPHGSDGVFNYQVFLKSILKELEKIVPNTVKTNIQIFWYFVFQVE